MIKKWININIIKKNIGVILYIIPIIYIYILFNESANMETTASDMEKLIKEFVEITKRIDNKYIKKTIIDYYIYIELSWKINKMSTLEFHAIQNFFIRNNVRLSNKDIIKLINCSLLVEKNLYLMESWLYMLKNDNKIYKLFDIFELHRLNDEIIYDIGKIDIQLYREWKEEFLKNKYKDPNFINAWIWLNTVQYYYCIDLELEEIKKIRFLYKINPEYGIENIVFIYRTLPEKIFFSEIFLKNTDISIINSFFKVEKDKKYLNLEDILVLHVGFYKKYWNLIDYILIWKHAIKINDTELLFTLTSWKILKIEIFKNDEIKGFDIHDILEYYEHYKHLK